MTIEYLLCKQSYYLLLTCVVYFLILIFKTSYLKNQNVKLSIHALLETLNLIYIFYWINTIIVKNILFTLFLLSWMFIEIYLSLILIHGHTEHSSSSSDQQRGYM